MHKTTNNHGGLYLGNRLSCQGFRRLHHTRSHHTSKFGFKLFSLQPTIKLIHMLDGEGFSNRGKSDKQNPYN